MLRWEERLTYGEPWTSRPCATNRSTNRASCSFLGWSRNIWAYVVESVQAGFPDCEAKRQIAPRRWQRVNIEI